MTLKINNQNKKSQTSRLQSFIGHVGVVAMSVAAFVSLVDMYEARGMKLMPTLQPAYSAVNPTEAVDSSTHQIVMRRERDEVRHISVSYGTSMRSHPTAGTV